MHYVAVLVFVLLGLSSIEDINGSKGKKGANSEPEGRANRKSLTLGGLLGFKVISGSAKISPDTNTATLQLQLQRNNPGQLIKGKQTPSFDVTPQTEEFTKEEEIGLAMHNEFRQIHQVPPLTLDRKMCDEAKMFAEKLAKEGQQPLNLAQKMALGQGQNVRTVCNSSYSSEPILTMEQAVIQWYNEVCYPGYKFNATSHKENPQTERFAQVVWKASTILGIGRAEAMKQEHGLQVKCGYVVAIYKPIGDLVGAYGQNVKKGSFDQASYCKSVPPKMKDYFDNNGKQVAIGHSYGPPQANSDHIEVVNKKKKRFVGSKHQ